MSFALSLMTAVRAYDLPKSDLRELRRRLIVHRLRTRPRDFLLPPGRRPAASCTGLFRFKLRRHHAVNLPRGSRPVHPDGIEPAASARSMRPTHAATAAPQSPE